METCSDVVGNCYDQATHAEISTRNYSATDICECKHAPHFALYIHGLSRNIWAPEIFVPPRTNILTFCVE